MANLVIVESPAKAGTIKGYLGSGYKVVASKGHVRDLPKSSLGIDIENNFEAKYINIRGKGDLIKMLKKEAKSAKYVYLATDPDREGEAISWHLANALELDMSKTRRVTFNEITKNAIKTAIKNPRDIDMALVNSQQARRILDRIVGYKLSPFLWKTVKSGLSAGRVQSVATRVIVEREEEIRNFVPSEYWTIDAELSGKVGKFTVSFYGDQKGKIDLSSKEDADKIQSAVDGKEFTVYGIRRSPKIKHPLPPFITSTLQQDASRKLGFQSQRTMRIAQELYEGVDLGASNGGVQGLITYMRTDSLRISSEIAASAHEYIVGKYGEKYYPKTQNVYKSKQNAQDAHEAIRPASLKFAPESIRKLLSSDQYKLYKLIWERFIASQMSSAELDTVSVDVKADKYIFRAHSSTVRFEGYLAVYRDIDDDTDGEKENSQPNSALAKLAEGDSFKAVNIVPNQHFTEPPQRYTEASLIKFLEEKGIGRPSTYSTIITTIISREYVVRDGKALKPTSLGEITNKLMLRYFPKIVDYTFTADMEDKLDGIEHSDSTITKVLGDFYGDFAKELENANKSVPEDKVKLPVEETDIICEKCGAKMIIKNSRYGKFAACPNYPNCKNTKPLDAQKATAGKTAEPKKVEKTGEKCEICGADMVIRQGRFGTFMACENYPKCSNTKPILKPIGVKCPECGADIVTKHSKNHMVFYSCQRYPECKFSSWDLPLEEKCPECGSLLYRKKGAKYVFCKKDGCNYRRNED